MSGIRCQVSNQAAEDSMYDRAEILKPEGGDKIL